MIDKLTKSIEQQKLRFAELTVSHDDTRRALNQIKDQLTQIRGAIVALEYARSLAEETAKQTAPQKEAE